MLAGYLRYTKMLLYHTRSYRDFFFFLSIAAPGKKSNEPTEEQLETQWMEMSSELTALLAGKESLPDDITPFDAASEIDVDQQR